MWCYVTLNEENIYIYIYMQERGNLRYVPDIIGSEII